MIAQAQRIARIGYSCSVYCTVRLDAEAFDARIDFDTYLMPYTGNDSWVEPKIAKLHACLNQDRIPAAAPACSYRQYSSAMNHVTRK